MGSRNRFRREGGIGDMLGQRGKDGVEKGTGMLLGAGEHLNHLLPIHLPELNYYSISSRLQ